MVEGGEGPRAPRGPALTPCPLPSDSLAEQLEGQRRLQTQLEAHSRHVESLIAAGAAAAGPVVSLDGGDGADPGADDDDLLGAAFAPLPTLSPPRAKHDAGGGPDLPSGATSGVNTALGGLSAEGDGGSPVRWAGAAGAAAADDWLAG